MVFLLYYSLMGQQHCPTHYEKVSRSSYAVCVSHICLHCLHLHSFLLILCGYDNLTESNSVFLWYTL
ncbi:hypothetical protein GBAR_LOCUS7541 [Geodia barretti]|uniref:Uncharacterized protein n=1 Tax=Geodia barretti TaxID=519541 RepID=A0AA35WFM9_GEOBA|nr:hypothetical protein GBAR_LOCUS7541 [Geodia barretti]